MARRRPITTTIPAGDVSAIEAVLTEIIANKSWVNFLPGTASDLEEHLPTSGPFSALFGKPVRPFAEISVVAGAALQIGVNHPLGRLSATVLSDRGLTFPPEWKLSQNHTRRGLVVTATNDPHAIAVWCARALVELTLIPAQQEWTIERYGRP